MADSPLRQEAFRYLSQKGSACLYLRNLASLALSRSSTDALSPAPSSMQAVLRSLNKLSFSETLKYDTQLYDSLRWSAFRSSPSPSRSASHLYLLASAAKARSHTYLAQRSAYRRLSDLADFALYRNAVHSQLRSSALQALSFQSGIERQTAQKALSDLAQRALRHSQSSARSLALEFLLDNGARAYEKSRSVFFAKQQSVAWLSRLGADSFRKQLRHSVSKAGAFDWLVAVASRARGTLKLSARAARLQDKKRAREEEGRRALGDALAQAMGNPLGLGKGVVERLLVEKGGEELNVAAARAAAAAVGWGIIRDEDLYSLEGPELLASDQSFISKSSKMSSSKKKRTAKGAGHSMVSSSSSSAISFPISFSSPDVSSPSSSFLLSSSSPFPDSLDELRSLRPSKDSPPPPTMLVVPFVTSPIGAATLYPGTSVHVPAALFRDRDNLMTGKGRVEHAKMAYGLSPMRQAGKKVVGM